MAPKKRKAPRKPTSFYFDKTDLELMTSLKKLIEKAEGRTTMVGIVRRALRSLHRDLTAPKGD